ncbi:MAG: 2-oxo acid dehydrogenase subunit E2 [Gammaproteobacteria bacterium]
MGDIAAATVIEVNVAVGDRVGEGDPLVVLESDKASMEVPASQAGRVEMETLQREAQRSANVPTPATAQVPTPASRPVSRSDSSPVSSPAAPLPADKTNSEVPAQIGRGDGPPANVSRNVHAGPAVRRLANALHADLSQITGSGPRGRILKEDVHHHVKQKMKAMASAPVGVSGSAMGTPLPEIDFTQWGETEEQALSRIQKLSAQYLHRSWTALPHVTQFEEADITDLESFRQSQKDRYAKKNIKLTPLAFIMKACALTLALHPKFKASLKPDGVTLVYKSYCHIGFACETPTGLVVPVVRDVDQKSVSQLAQEIVALSGKAREKRLKPEDMKGAVFSISSLGGIGGTAFTPIINWPEVAILGVSKNAVKPVWNGEAFVPRTCVPLSLSYDHRVIDGADAARFTTSLKGFLEDLRQWMI